MAFGLLDFLVCCIVIRATVFLYQLHTNRVVKLVNLFPGPKAIPVLGNVLEFNKDSGAILETFTKWTAEFGRRYRVLLTYMKPVVFISSPEDVEVILSSQDQINKADHYYPVWILAGRSLLTARAKKWRLLRKMMAPSFHYQALEKFLKVQNEESRRFAVSLEEFADQEGYFNIIPPASICTANTIIRTMFGDSATPFVKLAQTFIHTVDRVGREWVARLKRPWLVKDEYYKLTGPGQAIAEGLETCDETLDEIMKNRKREIQEICEGNAVDPGLQEEIKSEEGARIDKGSMSLLDSLMLKQAEGVTMMTDEEIRRNLYTVLAGGFDTSAHTTCYLLYNLGRNLEAQKLVHEELQQVFDDDSKRDVTSADLKELKYLEACIKETLRLFPVIPLIGRKLTDDLILHDDLILPKGVNVAINIFAMQRDAEYFPEPLSFEPSRFFQDNETKRHRFSYIPFSAGPRNCIGMRYAAFQVKTLAVHILRKFSVRAEKDIRELELHADVVLFPVSGLNVALKKN